MASLTQVETGGRTRRIAIAALLVASATLSACGQSAKEREMAEQLAAAQAGEIAAKQKLAAASAANDMPNPTPTPKMSEEDNAANGMVDGNDDDSAQYGDVIDPPIPDDGFDNDVNGSVDAPNDFAAPADPPLAGEIQPQDSPPPA